MLRSLFGAGAAALLFVSSGCAVVATRSEAFVGDEVYPAVRLDAAGWVLTCWPADRGQWGGDYSDPAQWILAPVMTAACLIDLVPSVAVDTVLLPVDLAFGD